MSHAPAILPGDAALPLERLEECVRSLDPATRALLDLSVRRGLGDETMAPMLRTDPFHLAWQRARALERVATAIGGEEPAPLAAVRAAVAALSGEAFLPAPALPERTAEPGAGTELVPLPKANLGAPRRPRRLSVAVDRLDAFAASAPTFRTVARELARAVGRKAVRTVVWRRRSA